jgi:hypothetical protein
MGGQKDEQGRRKPFRNIGNAIVDLEWRAKNIDRKSIEAHETDGIDTLTHRSGSDGAGMFAATRRT